MPEIQPNPPGRQQLPMKKARAEDNSPGPVPRATRPVEKEGTGAMRAVAVKRDSPLPAATSSARLRAIGKEKSPSEKSRAPSGETEALRRTGKFKAGETRPGAVVAGRGAGAVEAAGGGKAKRTVKINLALKFTIPVCALLALVILFWGWFLSKHTTEILVNEIKKSGMSRVQILAQIAEPMIKAYADAYRQKEWNDEKFWPTQFNVDEMEFRKLMGRESGKPSAQEWQNGIHKLALLAQYGFVSRLGGESRSSVATDVLNAYVTYAPGGEEKWVAGAQPCGEVQMPRYDWLRSPNLDFVNIGHQTFRLSSLGITVGPCLLQSGNTSHKVLLFSKQVGAGYVHLALSADVIEAELNRLRFTMIEVGAVALLLAAGICIFIAMNVTEPVKILIRDMEIVAGGNFDHRTRAHSNDEIGLMAVEFNEMTRRLAEAREREKEAMRVESDLALAKDVQRHFLPPRPPMVKGFDMEANYTPALQLGGDFYDFLPLDRERLGIAVADVSGKSVPGALQMATTRTTLRFLAPHSTSAAETLIKTNQVIAAEIKRGMFVTVFYVILNARHRTISCSSAGHNPLVLVHASGEYELINPAGIALGFDKGPIFQRTIKEQTIQLVSGDRVVLYTDGVVESMNARNQEYGAQRFYEFCVNHRDLPSKEFVAKLIKDLNAHKGNAEQHDDITIVTFRVD